MSKNPIDARASPNSSTESFNSSFAIDMDKDEVKRINCRHDTELRSCSCERFSEQRRHCKSADQPALRDTLHDPGSRDNRCQSQSDTRSELNHCYESNRLQNTTIGLLYCSKERLTLKDFVAEIRAKMDVEQFVHQAELILDTRETSVDKIVSLMLERVMSHNLEPAAKLEEARRAIFIQGSSMLMARIIQGISMPNGSENSSRDGSLVYDQSWLCAISSLSQISTRHMVIARFKQPVDMGDNAREVRLFMLILTPSKEKRTKDALETGRTFATLLTDGEFRLKLIAARDHVEFKSLMMSRAQQLSDSKMLKNRHKYVFEPAVYMSVSSLSNSCFDQNEMSSGVRLSSGGNLGTSPVVFERAGIDSNNNPVANNNEVVEPPELDGSSDRQQSNPSLFAKNPRTSKLLELISQTSDEVGKEFSFDFVGHEGCLSKQDNSGCFDITSLCNNIEFGKGLWQDFINRVGYYPSDFRDAFIGPAKTVQKTVATIWFLYFGILLPTIAFSSLNTTQTHGHMGDLRKAIIGQAIGGLCFALFGGQPLVIIMTTAPLCLYTKVIHQMCIDYGFHFPAMYAAVGLWNGLFLAIYSLFGFSNLMKWCTRSTEEIFALFIAIAFISDAGKDLMKNFHQNYYTPACELMNGTIVSSGRQVVKEVFEPSVCRRETSLLFVLLMLGTLWLAVTLYRFNKTPYLAASKRELLADYALPTAVLAMSFVGSFVFDDIYVEKLPPLRDIQFERAKLELLSSSGIFTSLGLGFTLSFLFFMDQNISAAMVNAPQNRLKKGCAYHFDLLVVGILNGFLTLYGLPMMHGVLPHSPLHVRSLADIEEQVEEGHLREVIVNVRETRVTGIVSHILVLGSLLLVPYPIAYIPKAVLNGLFLYMAITSLDGLQMFERILLLFTEQNKYPPNHYIRRCPQRKIHKFTFLQLLQLFVMCLFGFSPINIVEMFFPVIILLMIPFRHKIVPKYIDAKYLAALDGKHC